MRSSVPAPQRLHGLDAIRGVAAILVALRHIPFIAPDAFPESFLAVDLFFVLSGVVLSGAYEARLRSGFPRRAFLAQRVIRLYPLYLLGSGLGLVAFCLVPPASAAPVGILVACALIMCPVGGVDAFPLDCPTWSLLLEAVASIGYGLVVRVAGTTLLLATMGGCGLGLVALCLARADHSLDFGWNIDSLPAGLLRLGYSFCAGILVRRIAPRLRADASGGAAQTIAAWAILGIVTLILTARPSGAHSPFLELGSVLLGFPALVLAMVRLAPTGPSLAVFATLGALSYPLYAIHAPAAQIVGFAGGTARSGALPPAPWGNVVFMAALIGASLWVDRWFDRPVRARLAAALRERASRRRLERGVDAGSAGCRGGAEAPSPA